VGPKQACAPDRPLSLHLEAEVKKKDRERGCLGDRTCRPVPEVVHFGCHNSKRLPSGSTAQPKRP
jgi:hypothetical protein